MASQVDPYVIFDRLGVSPEVHITVFVARDHYI